MSVEAISWALAQPLDRSSAKFVLVAMANCANADMTCWPSVAYLSDATCQDRKTVLENIKRLKEIGIIKATEDRRGKTGQVTVYLIDQQYQKRVASTVPKTEPVPKTVPVPKTDGKSPVFPAKESRFSAETVPKTGHGTVMEPSVEPSGNRQKRSAPAARPSDVTEGTWRDWCDLRKAKKATASETAISVARDEATKAGMNLEAFLRAWVASGYQGFKADWIKPAQRATQGGNRSQADLDEINARNTAEAHQRLFGHQEIIDA